MITFKEQFDKLTRAYIADEVNAYFACACFVGNLLQKNGNWDLIRTYLPFGRSFLTPEHIHFSDGINAINILSKNTYTPNEILQLENTFIRTLEENTIGDVGGPSFNISVKSHPNYEEALFKAFSVTLDTLREIHESKGEKVDDFIFTKRQLQTAQ